MHLIAFLGGCVGRKSPSALYAEGQFSNSGIELTVEPEGIEPSSR